METDNHPSWTVLNIEVKAAEDRKPSWIMLAPLNGSRPAVNKSGKVLSQRFNQESLDRVVVNFKPDVLVDREHMSEIGDDTTAFGWAKELQVRQAGQNQKPGLYALVEFTDIGHDSVRNKRLRYPSAVFELDADGYPSRLLSIGLTNKHNLKELPPISVNKNSAGTAGKGADMELKEMAVALGLPETADQATVLNKAREIVTAVATLQTEVQTFKTAALNKEADEFVTLNKAKIKDPAAVKAQFVLNKEATVALFAGVAEPVVHGQEFKRSDAQTPEDRTTLNKQREEKRDQLIALNKSRGMSGRLAFETAQRTNPELFQGGETATL